MVCQTSLGRSTWYRWSVTEKKERMCEVVVDQDQEDSCSDFIEAGIRLRARRARDKMFLPGVCECE